MIDIELEVVSNGLDSENVRSEEPGTCLPDYSALFAIRSLGDA